MKFTDNMSVPLWKLKLLQNKQRKKEEEKRKEREAEEERLRKLPPWKRQAEQPKTVIIIDKNKSPNPVDLAELSKQTISSSKSKSSSAKQTAQPLVNGTAQKVDSGESLGNQGKVGRDEADSVAGVSEEHCAPVQNNVFLTLERKKRKAPPPPKVGSQINVIATNVPETIDPVKSANSSKKTLSPGTESAKSSKKTLPSGSESLKGNHIQQSNKLNGPSVIGNQKQSSTTKPLSSDDKKSLKEDVPKPKTKDSAPSTVKVGSSVSTSNRVTTSENSVTNSRSGTTTPSGSSAASSSKETNQVIKKEGTTQPGSITQIRTDKGVNLRGRKKSISELRGIFGGAIISSNVKSQTTNQTDVSGTSDKAKSQKASTDSKPPATVSSLSKQSNSTSLNPKVVSTSGQSVKKEDSQKHEESKKILNSSTTKTEHKSLPSAAKSPSPRHKPSSDLPASAIINLKNAGPLKNREGQLIRSPSVIDDDEEVTISLESPCSPQSRRLSKVPGSADAGRDVSNAGTANVSNGSPEKRKAPSAPHPAKIDTQDANTTSKEVMPEITKLPNTSVSKVEKKKIEYPKNFRDPNFVARKEETSKKEEIPYPSDFRKPGVAASTSNKRQDTVKPTSTKAPTVGDSKKEPVAQTVGKKTDQTSSDITLKPTDKKESEQKRDAVKTKDPPATSAADGHIPYPDDFRKPKTQQAGDKAKNKKDIIKPSDLITATGSPAAQQKDDNDNVTSGGIFGFKLRKTKKPEANGISVISQSNDNSKPKVDNSPKAPSSGLIALGDGNSSSAGKKKNVVKKFEKVDFIGYNSPTDKASALKSTEGESTNKRNVSFSSKEEEMFEYMSEEASITDYDETHQGEEEEAKKSPQKSPQRAKVQNGMKNGTLDNSYDEDVDAEAALKSNAPIRSSGGFQNLAAANVSAMDQLLGRGPRPAEAKEPPKPAPPPQQEQDQEDMSLQPTDGDLFSSGGHGTAALLF